MILVPTRPISRAEVADALHAIGYAITFRTPATGSAESTAWERGADQILLSSDALSGLALFVVTSTEPERVEAQIAQIVSCEPVQALIQRGLAATKPAEQAIAALRFLELGRFVRAGVGVSRDDIVKGLARWMTSEHRAVRTAAAEAPFTLDWPELGPAIEAMAASDPALAWIGPWWVKSREESEKRAKVADEKRARHELESSLSTLVDEKRWDEALSASEKALSFEKPSVVSLRARALAFEGAGRTWEAFFWASLWAAKCEEDNEECNEAIGVRDRIATKLTGAFPKLEAHLRIAIDRFDDEPVTAALSFMRQKATSPDAIDELSWFEGLLLVKKSYVRSKQGSAVEVLEPLMQRRPALAEGWMVLALARAANEDFETSEQAYVEAKHAANSRTPTDREKELAKIAHDYDVAEVTDASVLSALRWMFVQASDHANVYRVATDELAIVTTPKARAAALRSRAIAATFLKRHDEAIAGYRDAMSAGDDDKSGLLRFNLACELARAGRKDEAIDALKQAISCDDEWASKAREDDYFTALWQDRDFVATVWGLTETPTREQVETWITRSLGWSMRGEGDESVAEASRAVAGATMLDDRALLARALGQLGSAQTYYVSSGLAIETLRRATAIAREALASDAIAVARILHFLGAAQHAAQRFDDAATTYDEVLTLREKSLGTEAFEVAITLGDMARLASDRQDIDRAMTLQTKTREVLDAVVLKTSGDDRLDVLLNLALNEGNRAALALQAKLDAKVVLGHAEALAGFLEQLVEGGGSFSPQTLPRIRRVLGEAIEGASDEITTHAVQIAQRLLILEHPDPRVRAEKMYWAMLRGGIRELVAKGVPETEIAAGIARAVRGVDPGEPIRSHPSFNNLAAELASRLTGAGDLVMVAMSLDLAASGAQPVEEAIGGLETFALSNLTK